MFIICASVLVSVVFVLAVFFQGGSSWGVVDGSFSSTQGFQKPSPRSLCLMLLSCCFFFLFTFLAFSCSLFFLKVQIQGHP